MFCQCESAAYSNHMLVRENHPNETEVQHAGDQALLLLEMMVVVENLAVRMLD